MHFIIEIGLFNLFNVHRKQTVSLKHIQTSWQSNDSPIIVAVKLWGRFLNGLESKLYTDNHNSDRALNTGI